MAWDSNIEWTDATFNPWEGCQRISAGCDHCYAEAMSKRFGRVKWGAGEDRRRTSVNNWQQPAKWNRLAEAQNIRHRVFCASMADVWDNAVNPAWRSDLFTVIRATPNLDWLILTKRPQLIKLPALHENVWLGCTVENQEEANRRIPHLIKHPAVVRFLSVEPLLGPVELDLSGIDWVIIGGESGPKRRPFDLDWARSVRDQCARANVAYFFKQIDKIIDKKTGIPPDLMIREFPIRNLTRVAP